MPASAYRDLEGALSDPAYVIVAAPLTVAIVGAMRRISRSEIPDMPDRIVAATAVHMGVPVISRDRKIRASNVQSIW